MFHCLYNSLLLSPLPTMDCSLDQHYILHLLSPHPPTPHSVIPSRILLTLPLLILTMYENIILHIYQREITSAFHPLISSASLYFSEIYFYPLHHPLSLHVLCHLHIRILWLYTQVINIYIYIYISYVAVLVLISGGYIVQCPLIQKYFFPPNLCFHTFIQFGVYVAI